MFIRGGIIRVQPIIPCKFPHQMALVKCLCAFRLRKLAQNGCRGRSERHFPCKFPRNSSCEMSMCISTVQASIFPVNSCIKWLWWHVHVHFDRAGSHKTRHLIQKSCQETSYRELVEKSCQEDLLWRSCSEILPRDLLQRSCQETSYRDLVQRPGEASSDLAQRSFIESLNRDLTWDPSDLL